MAVDEQKQERVEYILQLGADIFRNLLPTLPKELLNLDLTMPQLKVVLLIFLSGPVRMSTIASGLGVSLATATGVIDRLVERDIVSRRGRPEDRRVVLCHLSENGHKLVDELWQSSRNRSKELLEAIDAPNLLLLAQALEALLKAAMATTGGLQPNHEGDSP